ncbi:ElyC/SanA/YdcF family protein [Candidatus Omnitrophota bacterium]
MLKGRNIICISSIDWDFIWQGHQEIMSSFARNGNRVLFIENTGVRVPGVRDLSRIRKRIRNWFSGIGGIRQELENLYVFSPVVLPFPYSRAALLVNRYLVISVLRKWSRVMHFDDPVIWVFLPTPLSLMIIESLNCQTVIYYCIDNFRASASTAKKIERSEIKLLKRADLAFVTSKALYDYCRKYIKDIHLFSFGVNYAKFEKIRLLAKHPVSELSGIKKPIVGYIGGVHKWVDLDLVKKTAAANPRASFVFIGPMQRDISGLTGLKNVFFLGKQDHNKIPDFINNFDVCIIPYLITDYTRNVYPTKLNEYLAMAKPVVSTALPEVENFNKENGDLVFIGKNADEFAGHVLRAVNEKDDRFLEKRILAAKNNSWELKIAKMNQLIEKEIDHESGLSFDWREKFSRFYMEARRRTIKLTLFLFCAYFLIFYTPLLWFCARPLKIRDLPRNAEAIVVFAGGVGESGKAGQGFEERVQYAVELYKQGYAKNMIFSSGYTYVFEEPAVMKALAVSLGVPETAIILEDEAKNTYENVKFTREILDKKGWDKILLVSSPYHMRRASLVFQKQAKEVKVIYTPITKSIFYSRDKRDSQGRKKWKSVNLAQIRGILHEYLGILYYRWKGNI